MKKIFKDSEILLSKKEVCEMTGLSCSTIQRYRRLGKIKAIKIVGAVKFRKSEILKLLARYESKAS